MPKTAQRSVRPMSVQIGMAASYWPQFFADRLGLEKALPADMEKMLLGIQAYQAHTFSRPAMDLKEIWRAGSVSIQAIPKHNYTSDAPVILLIPSLINKSTILDLLPERSLLRWLAGQGMNAYLLDWGDGITDESQADMDGVVTQRLIPAIAHLAQHTGGRPIHALGYCMGGTLLTAAAALEPQHFASLIMLAAPWDFHAGTQGLLNCIKFWTPSALPAMDEKGILPVDWIQTVFASLDPHMAAHKFAKFADMDKNAPEAELFIAVEDWLNDGVALQAGVAQSCIIGWFLKNEPMNGAWQVQGRVIDPAAIQCPVLIIASDKDRLVEHDTAAALAGQVGTATIHNPSCGHIGMIAGANSPDNVWEPIAQWLKK